MTDDRVPIAAWMHPTAGWTNKSREAVLSHCRKDGPLPVPLYAAPPTSAPADVVEALTRWTFRDISASPDAQKARASSVKDQRGQV